MESALKILEYAMTMEKQGQQFYLKYTNEIEGERFRKTFENLAKAEEEHYNIIKKAYEKLKEEGKLEASDVELSGGDKIFEKVLQEEKAMLDPEADLNLNDIAIMRMAYLVENDFTDFYKNAIERTSSPEVKELLATLSDWENTHRKMFYQEYRALMEAKWGKQQFAPF